MSSSRTAGDEAFLDRLYRWTWQVLSMALLASSIGSMTQGLLAWPTFATRAFSLYHEVIRSPIAGAVDAILPVWMIRPPLGLYDVVILWTSTAVAVRCALAAIGEPSILRQLVDRWGWFVGLLLFIPVYVLGPFSVVLNAIKGRGKAREMAWHVMRSLFLVYGVVGLLLFFLWQSRT
jgi:hypothetical protein